MLVQTEHQCTHGSAKDSSLAGKGQEDSLDGKRQETGNLLEER